jgi:hypothetical protein
VSWLGWKALRFGVLRLVVGLWACAPGVLAASVGAPTGEVEVITPSELRGWQLLVSGPDSPSLTDIQFRSGPDTPPAGAGSIQFGVATRNVALVMTDRFDGRRLDELTTLRYQSHVMAENPYGPVVFLRADRTGDGTIHDALVFHPELQFGTRPTRPGAVVPPQCSEATCLQPDTWQTWDAREGGWVVFDDQQDLNALDTLDAYLQRYPEARLARDQTGALGVGKLIPVNMVFRVPPAARVSVDALEVAFAGDQPARRWFDFEPDPTD